MTDETGIAPAFNEANIEKALVDAQGDLFVAAQLLGNVQFKKLDRAIRKVERLQAVFLSLKEIKALPEYDKASQAMIEQELARRMAVYRVDGLEAIHELATMQLCDNSAMAQVKLAAASKLVGGEVHSDDENGLQQTLRELNESFHKNAPRIKITRQTSVEIGPHEKTIDSTASRAD